MDIFKEGEEIIKKMKPTHCFDIMRKLLSNTEEVLEVKGMHFIPEGLYTKVHCSIDNKEYEITIKDIR